MLDQQEKTGEKPEFIGGVNLETGQGPSSIVVQEVDEKAVHALAYVGNMLKLQERECPGYYLGGKLFPLNYTVPDNFLARCRITFLQPGAMTVQTSQIPEKDRKYWVRSFQTQRFNVASGQFENITVQNPAVLYKLVYPDQEWQLLVGQGAVHLPMIKDAQAQADAQHFYFQNWTRIIRGLDVLPLTLKKLEEDIGEQQAKTNSADMVNVGAALLRGCQEYRRWGIGYIAFQTRQIKIAEKPLMGVDVPAGGGVQFYDEVAEDLMFQLGIGREDHLLMQIAQNMGAPVAPVGQTVMSDEEKALKLQEMEIAREANALRRAELEAKGLTIPVPGALAAEKADENSFFSNPPAATTETQTGGTAVDTTQNKTEDGAKNPNPKGNKNADNK